jgi:hypothetical protein
MPKRKMAMQEEYSQHSKLRSLTAMDDCHLSVVISSVERRVRAMCRVMQVYELNACDSINNLEKDYDDLVTIFSAFYEFVDFQMDKFSDLSESLDQGIRNVSVNKLRASDDFRLKRLPRSVFTSQHAYERYCEGHGFDPDELAESESEGGE